MTMNSFIESIISSLVVAIFFYAFFELRPRIRDRRNIKLHVESLLSQILGDCKYIILDLTNQSFDDTYWNKTHSSDEIMEFLKDVKIEDKLNSTKHFREEDQRTIGESVNLRIGSINDSIDVLLRYIFYLDSRLIQILGKIQQNSIISYWSFLMQPPKPVKVNDKLYIPREKGLAFYHKEIEQFYQITKELNSYYSSKHHNSIFLIKRQLHYQFYYKQDYIKSSNYASKLLSSDEFSDDRDVLILGLIANVKVKNYDTAFKIMKKCINRNWGIKEIIIEEFKDDKYEEFRNRVEYNELIN